MSILNDELTTEQLEILLRRSKGKLSREDQALFSHWILPQLVREVQKLRAEILNLNERYET
jgi:hypothetical protein